MISLETVRKDIAGLEQQREKARNEAIMAEGAIQILQGMLARAEQEAAVKAAEKTPAEVWQENAFPASDKKEAVVKADEEKNQAELRQHIVDSEKRTADFLDSHGADTRGIFRVTEDGKLLNAE